MALVDAQAAEMLRDILKSFKLNRISAVEQVIIQDTFANESVFSKWWKRTLDFEVEISMATTLVQLVTVIGSDLL